MRTAKKYPFALISVFMPLMFGTPVIAAFFPKFTHFIFYLNNTYIVLGIALMFIPLKSFHQSLKTTSIYSYLISFLKISLLQFFLIVTAIDLYIVFIKLMPVPSTIHINQLLQSHLSELIKWGLFPWSAMTLMGLTLTYYRETIRNNIALIETTKPLTDKYLTKAFGAGIEIFLRQGLITSASLLAMAIGLTVYFYAIAFGTPKILFAPNGYTLVIFLLIFIGASSRYWYWIIKLFWRRGFSILQLFWLQTLFSIFLIIVLTFILNFLAKNLGIDLNQGFVFPIPKLPFTYAWELFMWSFWMGSIVFIAPMLANIAKGKNLRIIFIFSLFWPFLCVAFWLSPNFQPIWDKFFLTLNNPVICLSINAFVTVMLSCYFWCNKSFERLIHQSFYGQNVAKNSHIPIKPLTKILRLMSLFLLLYLFDDINLLSLVLFGMVSSCYLTYLMAGMGLVKTLWSKKNM